MDTCSDVFFDFRQLFLHAVPKSISVGMAAVEIVVKFLRTHVVSA